ncbi:molybdate ABC transporter permease subunit [Pseudaeromonas sp. ZJS20]|uniref:molybdate ABC transporter permease subunit n=1 Tax=Pseudaeromonas aegiceratis TaxID=3153928 RepID=UPI00390C5335
MSPMDWQALLITLKMAVLATSLLLLLATPLAWWLATTASRWRPVISTLTTLPMVLPPTVLGFYLLILMGPSGPLGRLTEGLGLGTLPFTFTGIVLGSVVHSLPFVVQPLQNAFAAIGPRPLEVAATLRAGPWDTFVSVVLPLARPGFITAGVLGFCHAIGEFGVVLMIGGNIPGKTRVLSTQIYNHVEALEYAQAHWLAGGMVLFAALGLLLIYGFGQPRNGGRP